MWFRKPKSSPAAVAKELRENVFMVGPEELGLAAAAGHQNAWAVLMETGLPDAVVTLACIADGTASMYFSKGGGFLGGGELPAVRDASAKFIALVDSRIADFAETTDHPLPAVGQVAFYVRTFSGLRSAHGDSQDLARPTHALSAIFRAGHGVITAFRESGKFQ